MLKVLTAGANSLLHKFMFNFNGLVIFVAYYAKKVLRVFNTELVQFLPGGQCYQK